MRRRQSTRAGETAFAMLAGVTLVVIVLWGGWAGLGAVVAFVGGALFIAHSEDRHRPG